MRGVFVMACLPILGCVGSALVHPKPDETGVVKQEDGKPIAESHVGEVSTEKADSKSSVESHVGVSSPEKSDTHVDVTSSVESHVGANSPEKSDNTAISTAVSSSAEVNADTSKVSTVEVVESSSAVTAVNPSSSKPSSESSVEFDHNHPEYPHEEPNVVDKVSHARSDDAEDSGNPMFQFIFLACGGGAVAWLFLSKQLRTWQHDVDFRMQFEKKFKKPSDTAMRMHSMLEPIVKDAQAAIGGAVQAADKAQKKCFKKAVNAVAQSSSQQKADDNDLLTFESEEFQENLLDDEDDKVPTLVPAPLQ